MPPLKSPIGIPTNFRVSRLVEEVAIEFTAMIDLVNAQIAIAIRGWIDMW